MKQRIAFIVGAGASRSYGLPTAVELTQQIENDRNVLVDFLVKSSTDQFWSRDELYEYHNRQVRDFALQLRRSGNESIDRFLEGRPDLLQLGKQIIAGLLLPLEHKALSDWPYQGDWLGWVRRIFFRTEHDLENSGVTFITFNYDRLISLGIGMMLANSLGSPRDAQRLANRVPVIHIYGSLWSELATESGQIETRVTPYAVQKSSENLRIMSGERLDPIDSSVSSAEDAICTADLVVFLGFSYDKLNLERIGIREDNPLWHLGGSNKFTVFGTTYGLQDRELKNARRRIGSHRIHKNGMGSPTQDCLALLRDKLPIDD